MLDFAELDDRGRGLEQLVREVLILLGFNPHWSGEGADGGRDLTFEEPGIELLGSKLRRWLVSCKDGAAAGRPVGVAAADGLIEALEHHGAHGFLLVCSTHPTAALVTRLEEIDGRNEGMRVTHVWDGVTLERLLATPRGWAVAQRFMPASAGRAGGRSSRLRLPTAGWRRIGGTTST